MSSINATTGEGGKVLTAPLNSGQVSVIPGGLSANRILLQRKLVDQMLLESEGKLRALEIEERGTPDADVTPLFKVRKGAADREVHRLKLAQRYWKELYEKELARLKSVGMQDEFRKKYQSPDDLDGPIRPEEVNIPKLMAPDPPSLPDPSPTDPKQCKDANPEWLGLAWERFFERLAANQRVTQHEWDLWQVNHHFWELRRDKTLAKGKPFAEPEPPKPGKVIIPDLPPCPLPSNPTQL